MIGHRVYAMPMQYPSREYDCAVTFVRVSDIILPLQPSRSFPSAVSSALGKGIPKRFLKLTTLYGTGQQEIGEFQISGSECSIEQRRSYKFVPTDSGAVTKLHIYVDEVFNSGLTGHVTIDLKEFIGEDDSEVYLEYPLSASNSRQRTAKLQVVVQCKGPPEHDNDDCLDMDLETFLYDEFPDSLLKSSYEGPEAKPLPHLAGSVGEDNLDALDQQEGSGLQPKFGDNNQDILGQQQRDGFQSQTPSLNDFQGDFLGLDSILKDFVTEYAQTRPFLVIAGHSKKPKGRKHPTQRELHAAVFFAAGVTMQQRLQSFESNCQSTLLRTEDSADPGISSTTGASRVLLRSQSDEFDAGFDVKRILSGPERPLPEVVTVSKVAAQSELKLNEATVNSAGISSSPDNYDIESANGSTVEDEWQGRRYVPSHVDFHECLTCSAESRTKDTLPCHENCSPAAICDGSIALTRAEETEELIPVSSSKPKSSAVTVVRNILGILFIAGVSFVLGAQAGFLGATCDTDTDGASKWSEIQQMGAWKEETLTGQMGKFNSCEVGVLQRGQSPQQHPSSCPLIVANKIGHPEQLRQVHRKIAMPSAAGPTVAQIVQDRKAEVLRETDWKEAYDLNNLLAKYRREGEHVGTIKQQEASGVDYSPYIGVEMPLSNKWRN